MKFIPIINVTNINQIIALIAGSAGLLILLAKYWKKITTPFKIWWFWHTTGYNLMVSIENNFGIEAGKKIKEMFYNLHNRMDIKNIRLDLLENTLNLGIYICDENGKCIYANNTISSIFDLDKSEMIGSGWLKPVKDKEKVFKEWKFSVENNLPYKTEYELLNGKVVSTEAYPSIQEGITISWVGLLKEKQ